MPNTSKQVKIDPFREKLSNLVNESLLKAYWYDDYPNSDDMAKYLIANGVTIPVRCKDCKHKTVTSDGMVCECALPTKRMQDYYIYGSTILARVEPDAFCSYGERRTDG